jgi:hypothetical protein
MPRNLREVGRRLREAIKGISRAAVETRVQKIRERSRVKGEIGVFEKDGKLIVTPVTEQKEFLREELGDRETAPRGIWRKSLRHGDE